MNTIIVHPGAPHRDEFLACCLLISHVGNVKEIWRREPEPAELEDPNYWVMDIGMRHEPDLHNFDHHQRAKDEEPQCAFSLLAQHLGLEDLLSVASWYKTSVELDVNGPQAVADALDLPRFPFELGSPIEAAMLASFGEYMMIEENSTIMRTMRVIGNLLIHRAEKGQSYYQKMVENTTVKTIRGEQVLIQEFETPQDVVHVTQAFRNKEFPDASILVAHDNRGDGWVLYRFDDAPMVDFTRVEFFTEVIFAASGGFIAKTSACELSQALEITTHAIYYKDPLYTGQ